MNAGGLAAGIIMIVAAVVFGPWLCTKVWRDPAFADQMTQSGRVLPFSNATSRGVTRGMIGLWAGLGFIGAGTVTVALTLSTPTHTSTATITAVVLYCLGVLGIALNVTIIWFNRPRSLVPPHMRDEDGLFTAWRKAR
jgi:hypothetical protein